MKTHISLQRRLHTYLVSHQARPMASKSRSKGTARATRRSTRRGSRASLFVSLSVSRGVWGSGSVSIQFRTPLQNDIFTSALARAHGTMRTARQCAPQGTSHIGRLSSSTVAARGPRRRAAGRRLVAGPGAARAPAPMVGACVAARSELAARLGSSCFKGSASGSGGRGRHMSRAHMHHALPLRS